MYDSVAESAGAIDFGNHPRLKHPARHLALPVMLTLVAKTDLMEKIQTNLRM